MIPFEKHKNESIDVPPVARKRFVFVGAFAASATDGTVGGQAFACQALLASSLSSHVDWVLLDSTMRSQPPPNIVVRSLLASRRLLRFVWIILSQHIDGVLIFSAYEMASFLEKGLMCLFAQLAGKRVVLSIRSEIRPFSHDPVFKWARKKITQACDCIICQSEIAANNLVDLTGCISGKISIIHNWVDTRYYAHNNHSDSEGTIFTFLFLGWLERFKGVYEVVAAVSILKERGYRFRVIMCGDGSRRADLEARSIELKLEHVVEFRGWVGGNDKLKALANADVFLLPSYSEGMPNSILEAMSAGIPVIASDVGGIPALVKVERNGFLVPPRDAEALADAMACFLQNPQMAREIGLRNQQDAYEQHDLETVWPMIAKAMGIEY